MEQITIARLKAARPSRSRIPIAKTPVAKTIVGRIQIARASRNPIATAFLSFIRPPSRARRYTAAIMTRALKGSEKKYPEYGKIRVPKATHNVAISAVRTETPSAESVKEKNAIAPAAARALLNTAPNT